MQFYEAKKERENSSTISSWSGIWWGFFFFVVEFCLFGQLCSCFHFNAGVVVVAVHIAVGMPIFDIDMSDAVYYVYPVKTVEGVVDIAVI